MQQPRNRPGAIYGQHPITYRRKKIFLDTLRQTGSVTAAARAATPHSRHRQGGLSTWLQLAQRDPDFSEAMQAAKDDALGRFEAEAVRRAVEGVERPIVSGGVVVVTERVYSDTLLTLKLRALAPEKYTERKNITLEGDVRVVGLMIAPQDLLALSGEQRTALEGILETIADARSEPAIEGEFDEVPALPPPAEPEQ
jgi:hypothetical protein